jgi:hypothetical protein
MKPKLLFRAFLIGAWLTVAQDARAAAAAELLEKGIYLEETRGELAAASGIWDLQTDRR